MLAWQTRNVEMAFFRLMKHTKHQSGHPLIKDAPIAENNVVPPMLGCSSQPQQESRRFISYAFAVFSEILLRVWPSLAIVGRAFSLCLDASLLGCAFPCHRHAVDRVPSAFFGGRLRARLPHPPISSRHRAPRHFPHAQEKSACLVLTIFHQMQCENLASLNKQNISGLKADRDASLKKIQILSTIYMIQF